MKNFVILMLLLGIGLSFAIGPATNWTVISEGKYVNNTANATGDITEGGNVTNLNMATNLSTEKWAGYWGNITSNSRMYLSPGPALASNVFYSWTWNASQGGKVCAIAANGFNWAAPAAVTVSNVDTVWGFNAADADSAANTLKNSCTITVANTSITSVGNATGVGGFTTCAIGDGTYSLGQKQHIAFCTAINSTGSLFNGQTGNYELLVAANATNTATETYYFWVELD